MHRPNPDSCHIARNARGTRLSVRQKILRMGGACPLVSLWRLKVWDWKHGFHRTDGEAMSKTGAA